MTIAPMRDGQAVGAVVAPAHTETEADRVPRYSARHAAYEATSPPPLSAAYAPRDERADRTESRGFWATLLEYLPRGNTLDETAFRQRHLLLCWVLGLHVPALFAFGVLRGYGAGHTALEVLFPAACVVFARVARQRRVAAFFVSAGLVYCSSVLVHLSGGSIEAHFHFFILVGLIGLYQDWVPFALNVAFTVLSHGLGSAIASDLMFGHDAGQNRPWTWAVVHGVADLAEAQVRGARAEAAQRQAVSDLFVNLARRNQSLLDRQLNLIGELEASEKAPDALADLFQLDHLATRIRRNAESLLVLSGEEAPRRWGRPVALGEVVRAAAAEVEDFERVEVLVSDYLEIEGRAVADLAHLLAELIENATVFSPPSSEVRVRSHLSPSEASMYVVSIEDTGIGMSPADLDAANRLLAEPPDVDLARSTLGFHVVGRLARRYNLRVRLANTPGGGITSLVTLPDDLVTERRSAPGAPGAPSRSGADTGIGAAAGADRLGPSGGPRLGGRGGDGLAGTGTGGPGNRAGALGAGTGPPSSGLPQRIPGAAVPAAAASGPALTSSAVATPSAAGSLPPAAFDPPVPAALALPAPGTPAPGAPGDGAAPPAADGRLAGPTRTPGATLAGLGGRSTDPSGTFGPTAEPSPFDPSDPALDPTTMRIRRPGRPAEAPGAASADATGAAPGSAPATLPAPVPAPAALPASALAPSAPTTPLVPTAAFDQAGGASPAPLALPPVTRDGLARRVPGAGLASLRRSGAGAIPPAASGGPGPDGGPIRAAPAHATDADRERMRSMLSRFQASQRAGRAAATDGGSPEKPLEGS